MDANTPLGSQWFSEQSPLWPGQALSLEMEKVLFDGKSDYQHVVVYQSKTYGKVLVLDGAIQLTERDEFAYQEMIAHLPILSHPNPKKICIIGGGDGAVLRQLVKYKNVEEIHMCEIDELVINKGKEFFPQFKKGYDDPRAKVLLGDGLKYIEGLTEPIYDIIIVDSSDPIGPASTLFEENFYSLLSKKALRSGGILCTQSECIWLHLDLISTMFSFCKNHFANVEYAYTTIPTYPSGQIGFLLCSKADENGNVLSTKKPLKTPSEAFVDEEEVESLRYYSTEIHSAAFILPKFATKALSS